MAVIGCDIPVGHVVGAEKLADARAGLWAKTHFFEKGGYLHSRTYLVAAGEPMVLEFRVDLKPLEKAAARIHQRLHERAALARGMDPTVAGFSFSKAWKAVKGTAKKIGKSKLIKAVGKGIKSVAKSKLVGGIVSVAAVAVPGVGVAALAAYGAANAAIKAVDEGKKLVQTANKAKTVISKAGSMAGKLTAAKVAAPAKLAAANAQVKASALARAKLAAQTAVKKAASAPNPALAAAAKAKAAAQAKATLAAAQAKAKAQTTATATQLAAAQKKVAPVVAAAKSIEQKLSDPAVRAKLLAVKARANSAKKTLEDIKEKVKFGTGAEKLDAQKSAAIVNLVARNNARIQAISQVNAGGLPSMLIDGKGRIIPGRWKILPKAGGRNPDVLYQGPKKTFESGAFSRVSGEVVGAAHDSHARWWTLEIQPKNSSRWVNLQNNGILFREHWQAAKAVDWYGKQGISAKAKLVTTRPSDSQLRKAARGVKIGAPFAPPSPRDKREKEALYAAWLKSKGARVGSVPSTWSIGCECEGSLF